MTTDTTARRVCVCARHTDGSVTTSTCPIHADTDPCLTMALITGRRRKGTIRRGVCTACGHGRPSELTYREHVSHAELTYPTPENPGSVAWDQIGPGMTDHTGTEYYGVRGMDGREYVAEGTAPGAWRIVRAGHYGLGAVTRAHTLKGAVQHLNAFHAGEVCAQCGNVNSERGHACEACGRIRYVDASGAYVAAGDRSVTR